MDKKKSGLIKVKGDANRHLYKLNEIYWVKLVKNGRVLRRSLGTSVLSTARLLRDDAVAKFLNLKIASNKQRKIIADLFPVFLETKSTKAVNTILSMKNTWEKHLIFFDSYLPDEIDELIWIKYVEHKRKSDSDRKFFNDRKYLMMFLNWCHRNGYISKLPKLENVDPKIKEGKVYTKEQISSLLENANPDLKLQILIAISMGMRIGEIMSLEWDQIDFKKETIYLPAEKTKIRKARKFSISPACVDLLKERKKNSLGKAVFPNPENPDICQGRTGNKNAWSLCKKNAGIPKEYRFHWLRHTFLTNAFKSSVNPALICEYAGLSLDEAQKTYLHFSTDDTKTVSELVKLHE